MVAFLASSRRDVDMAHTAAIRLGAVDEGSPNLRLRYGKDYYGAYFRDPDGNKIHVVHRPEDLPKA